MHLHALARLATPHPTQPHLSFPTKLAPVGRDKAVFQRLSNHAPVPKIGTQNMTSPTQAAQAAHLIGPHLSALDVVDVGFR
jgi:hypothetical protein